MHCFSFTYRNGDDTAHQFREGKLVFPQVLGVQGNEILKNLHTQRLIVFIEFANSKSIFNFEYLIFQQL